MYAHANKSKENKSSALANSDIKKGSSEKRGLKFVDKRTEVLVQQKLAQMMNDKTDTYKEHSPSPSQVMQRMDSDDDDEESGGDIRALVTQANAKIAEIKAKLALAKLDYGKGAKTPGMDLITTYRTEVDELNVACEGLVEVVEEMEQVVTKLEEALDSIGNEEYGEAMGQWGEAEEEWKECERESLKLEYNIEELSGTIELNQEKVEVSEAKQLELNLLRAGWVNAGQANGHFKKHKGDTGLANEVDYYNAAKALILGGDAATLTKVVGDRRLYFNPTSGFFGVNTGSGILSFFKPTEGQHYYDKQK